LFLLLIFGNIPNYRQLDAQTLFESFGSDGWTAVVEIKLNEYIVE
jgi:hypothetical protein